MSRESKKDIEGSENNSREIEDGATIEMTLRLQGGMKSEESAASAETAEQRQVKRAVKSVNKTQRRLRTLEKRN